MFHVGDYSLGTHVTGYMSLKRLLCYRQEPKIITFSAGAIFHSSFWYIFVQRIVFAQDDLGLFWMWPRTKEEQLLGAVFVGLVS